MRRVGWGFVDQALSSASNVLLVFTVAGVSSIHEFGVFSLAMAVLLTVLSTCRGMLGTPVALLAGREPELRAESGHSLVAGILSGLVASVLMVGVILATGSAAVGIPLAVACPVVLAQDCTRFIAVAQGAPWLAALSDGWWTVAALGLFGLAQAGVVTSPGPIIWLWTLSALIGFVIGAVTTRTVPTVGGLRRWWRTDLHARLGYGGEALIGATSGLVVLAAAAGFIGTAASAALRGAASTLGPIAVVFRSIPIAVVPDVRLRGLETSEEIWRYMRRIAIPLSAFSLLIGAVSLVVPDALGRIMLGDSWTVIQPLLPVTATEFAFLGWLNCLNGGMRAQGRSGELLKVRLVFAGASLVLGCGAAVVFGTAMGVALSLVGAAAVAVVYSRVRMFAPAPG